MTPVAEIDQVWDWVRLGLEDVIKKTNADWSAADVYLMLKHKVATLYTLGEDDGFCILQKQQDVRGPYLFVWVIWGNLKHIEKPIMAAIRKIAIEVGAKTIQMKSPRKGWERWGWEVKEVIYEANVWPGAPHG